jgi:hypothetical protein
MRRVQDPLQAISADPARAAVGRVPKAGCLRPGRQPLLHRGRTGRGFYDGQSRKVLGGRRLMEVMAAIAVATCGMIAWSARHAACPDVTAGISKLRGSVVPDVTRIGIDHGEEHADALSMLLHRPIRCPARRESVALVGPAQPVVGGAAVSSLVDGEPFAIDVEGEQHRPGPSRGSAVHIGNGAGIVAATAGAPVHDSQYPRAGTAQPAPAARVDRPAADE